VIPSGLMPVPGGRWLVAGLRVLVGALPAAVVAIIGGIILVIGVFLGQERQQYALQAASKAFQFAETVVGIERSGRSGGRRRSRRRSKVTAGDSRG
jgi:hypothetical protein